MKTWHGHKSLITLSVAFLTTHILLVLFVYAISASVLWASTTRTALDRGALAAATVVEPPVIGKIQLATLEQQESNAYRVSAPLQPATPQSFALTLRAAIGLDEHVCADQPILNVTPGTMVVYCYFVTNTGTEDINFHSAEDRSGLLMSGEPHTLRPGGVPAFITRTAIITETTVNIGTWHGVDNTGAILASASASAKVYVNALSIHPGVGQTNEGCPRVDEFSVLANTDAAICYRLVNHSELTLTDHTLIESKSGKIADAVSYPLAPGESVTTRELGLTLSDIVTTTTPYSLTWSASTTDFPSELSGDRLDVSAFLSTVFAVGLTGELTVGTERGTCATTKALTVFAGAEVVFCYLVKNRGSVTFTHHTVTDNFPIPALVGTSGTDSPKSKTPEDMPRRARLEELLPESEERIIVENTFYEMKPGSSGQITNVQTAYTSTVVTMTWVGLTPKNKTPQDARTGQEVFFPLFLSSCSSCGYFISWNGLAYLSSGISQTISTDASSVSFQPTSPSLASPSLASSSIRLPVLLSAAASSQVTITVLPLADINITIYEDANQNGAQDAEELGIPAVTVLLTTDTEEPFTAVTDQDGIATFTNLQPAVYEITIRPGDPFQTFEPVGSSVTRLLLRSGTNEDAALGYQRIGDPPQKSYLPIISAQPPPELEPPPELVAPPELVEGIGGLRQAQPTRSEWLLPIHAQ